MRQMHRQSLTAYGHPLCETVVECPSPRGSVSRTLRRPKHILKVRFRSRANNKPSLGNSAPP